MTLDQICDGFSLDEIDRLCRGFSDEGDLTLRLHGREWFVTLYKPGSPRKFLFRTSSLSEAVTEILRRRTLLSVVVDERKST